MMLMRTVAGLGAGSGYLGARVGRLRPGRPVSLSERLRNIPTEGAPVSDRVEILWNEHHVPFIEAASDRDLAVGNRLQQALALVCGVSWSGYHMLADDAATEASNRELQTFLERVFRCSAAPRRASD